MMQESISWHFCSELIVYQWRRFLSVELEVHVSHTFSSHIWFHSCLQCRAILLVIYYFIPQSFKCYRRYDSIEVQLHHIRSSFTSWQASHTVQFLLKLSSTVLDSNLCTHPLCDTSTRSSWQEDDEGSC